MPKFIIRYNAGFGADFEVVQAKDRDEAEKMAYDAWHQAAQDQADYEALAYTKELAEGLGLE